MLQLTGSRRSGIEGLFAWERRSGSGPQGCGWLWWTDFRWEIRDARGTLTTRLLRGVVCGAMLYCVVV